MSNRLPPPDPHESSGASSDEEPVYAPTAVYLQGSPSSEADRLSDAILEFRPGLLIVLDAAA